MALELVKAPDTTQLDTQATSALAFAESLGIDNMADYAAAGAKWKMLRSLAKEISDTFGPIKAKLHEAHKEAVAQESRHLLPVIAAQRTIKGKMAAYDAKQERIRREEEARLQRVAHRQAEEAALREAAAAEAAGDSEAAEAIMSEPVAAPPVILPSSTPRTGVTFREVWKFRITDERLIPRQYLMPDAKKIGGVVRAMRDGTQIPGIEVYSEKV